ncbi:MAG TPA: hypothetical protein VHW04_21105 [Solirubrobacteraceae bacterium]|nr:hypothetical protein [Solirubrobacteraceae bacterium]
MYASEPDARPSDELAAAAAAGVVGTAAVTGAAPADDAQAKAHH